MDIICIQEVDKLTERTSRKDITKMLAAACNMPYYHFYSAMDYMGGNYGIAILSRYALSNCETIKLKTNSDEEPRVLAKAEVKTENGNTITIFNTHLSYESEESRRNQIEYINEQVKGDTSTFLMGDFNIGSFEEYHPLSTLIPMNTEETPFVSYRGNDENFRCLDNIFYSSDFRINNAYMIDYDASDHNMLVIDAQMPK